MVFLLCTPVMLNEGVHAWFHCHILTAMETVAVPYSYFDALLYMYRNTSENLWEVNLLPLQPHSAQNYDNVKV